MAHLVIDAGNTNIKVAVFNNRKIEAVRSFEEIDTELLLQIASEAAIDKAILSTVRQDISEIETFLSANFNYIRFSHEKAEMIKNHYKSKATLGLDRLAAVVGANALYPASNCLVIDSGTCITYDFIDSEANYSGGSISPGINMRFKAMHTLTGKLPMVEAESNFTSPSGSTTETSMLSGVQNGILYEAEGFIKYYHSSYSNLAILLCGGDSGFFDTRLKNTIFAPAVKAEPHLVLIGLNEIIHRNTND